MADVSNSEDIIDVRDIIERVEQLENLRQPGPVDTGKLDDADMAQDDLFAELAMLEALLGDLRGNGGDHDWRGDWYPVTLIRDSYWEESAREFAEDVCGEALRKAQWPMNCIDWERAATELQIDYSSVEYAGVTYWYR